MVGWSSPLLHVPPSENGNALVAPEMMSHENSKQKKGENEKQMSKGIQIGINEIMGIGDERIFFFFL